MVPIEDMEAKSSLSMIRIQSCLEICEQHKHLHRETSTNVTFHSYSFSRSWKCWKPFKLLLCKLDLALWSYNYMADRSFVYWKMTRYSKYYFSNCSWYSNFYYCVVQFEWWMLCLYEQALDAKRINLRRQKSTLAWKQAAVIQHADEVFLHTPQWCAGMY